ncbi:MAG TPA: hypothetical protein DCX06_02875 [Opitutae bacterium]|nr:hypothetical protein [Opitutae bacterium]
MDFIKKNLVFCLIVVICLLACAAGAFLAYTESGSVQSEAQKAKSAQAQLNNLLVASPAPSADNVAASEQNVAALKAELEKIRSDLQRGSRMNTSSDGVGVMAGIQQYISEYQRRVADVVDADGEPAPIETPKDFAFGFQEYIETGAPLQDPKVIATLDKQRQILSYIVNQLIDSNPAAITAIKREVLEVKSADDKSGKSGKTGFQISSAISARVPGAIDTMAYSVTFTGYTASLRAFLNNLAQFDLPIVVRSIEVQRPQGSATTAAPKKGNALDDIFGAFGGASSTTVETTEEAQKPIIEENLSSFTVVLEFIEIILPQNAEQNPS